MSDIPAILDKLLPYTKDECRCGFKKKRKQEQRIKLATAIYDYRHGKEVDFNQFNIDVTLLSKYLNRNQNANDTRR